MKKTTLIVAMCLGVGAGYAQDVKEADVPAATKDAFAKKYPGLKAEWEKEDGNYEAEFDGKRVTVENGKTIKQSVEGTALISPDGNILETEEEIDVKALPKSIPEYVAKTFGGKKVSEAYKITDAAGTVSYEVELGKDEYMFDANGGFLKKVEKKEEKDDDDDKEKKAK